MKLVARIRMIVDVPFDHDVPDSNPDDEQHQQTVQKARADAAKAAEKLAVTVKPGTIVDTLVEEVREA